MNWKIRFSSEMFLFIVLITFFTTFYSNSVNGEKGWSRADSLKSKLGNSLDTTLLRVYVSLAEELGDKLYLQHQLEKEAYAKMCRDSLVYEKEKMSTEYNFLKSNEIRTRQKFIRYGLLIGSSIVLLSLFLFVRCYLSKGNCIDESSAKSRKIADLLSEMNLKNSELAIRSSEIEQAIPYLTDIRKRLVPSEVFLNLTLKDYFFLSNSNKSLHDHFYWINTRNKMIIIAIGDSHLPGIAGLSQTSYLISKLEEHTDANENYDVTSYYELLSREYKRSFQTPFTHTREDSNNALLETNNGEDIRPEFAICTINTKSGETHYCGCENRIYLLRKGMGAESFAGEIDEQQCIISVKEMMHQHVLFALDYKQNGESKVESKNRRKIISFTMKQDDRLYLYTDGLVSLKGGANGKKLGCQQIEKYLIGTSHSTLKEQHHVLLSAINKHKEYDKNRIITNNAFCMMGIMA